MTNRTALSKIHPTLVLDYRDAKSFILTFVFVSLNIFTPWLAHQFHLAGASFLPMHFFALTAGLLFGWRAGLITGFSSPLLSYAVSDMPPLHLLAQVTAELSSYGLAAGILREKARLPIVWSLTGAMVAGRIALFLTMLAVQFSSGSVHGVAGPESTPLSALYGAVKQGLPGIALQLLLIPLLTMLASTVLWRHDPAN